MKEKTNKIWKNEKNFEFFAFVFRFFCVFDAFFTCFLRVFYAFFYAFFTRFFFCVFFGVFFVFFSCFFSWSFSLLRWVLFFSRAFSVFLPAICIGILFWLSSPLILGCAPGSCVLSTLSFGFDRSAAIGRLVCELAQGRSLEIGKPGLEKYSKTSNKAW